MASVYERVVWLALRLRNMSPAEWMHRVREVGRKWTTRRFREGWAAYDFGGEGCPALPGIRERVLGASPDVRATIGQAAERFMEGHFESLGVRWPTELLRGDFPGALWTTDPVTGRQWPGRDAYCFDISYRLSHGGADIKHVWEIGRLQFLSALGAQALLHDEPRALHAVAVAIDSWHEHNPPFRGVHWAELLNVAIRAINLLVTLSLCGDRLPQATVRRARSMLNAHRVLLGLFPSLHSSANNHLVAELSAEYLIAVAMPASPWARGLRARAARALEREAKLQLLADGSPAEQSPSYGAFTAEFLLLSAAMGEAGGDPVPTSTRERLQAFAAYVESLCNPRGMVPALGDNDEGRVLTLCRHEPQYPLSVAASIRAWYAQPLAATPPPPELRHALFGTSVGEAAGSPLPAADCCADFPLGGLAVSRRRLSGRDCLLTFDHGPLGYLSIAAHGHADALAVTLDVDGDPVLADPGTYLYHGGGAWRQWFRGTGAHNTLRLGGVDQSQMAGPFNWRTKASVRVEAVGREGGWVRSASHDGYQRRFGVRHVREVAAIEGGYRITDMLKGDGAGALEAEVVFQAGPGLGCIVDGQSCTLSNGDGPLLRLEFAAPGQLRTRSGGDAGAGGGWLSPRFCAKQAAERITWTGCVPTAGATVRVIVLSERDPS